MATEGPRRSTRARKPVKSYAEDQAEQDDSKITAQASRPSKHKKTKATDEDYDNENGEITSKKRKADEEEGGNDDADAPAKKRRTKKGKAASKRDSAPVTGWTKKGLSIFIVDPKTIPTDTSWHAEAAESRNAAREKNVEQLAPGEKEKRLKAYVTDPPPSYHSALKKVNKERMFVLSRERAVQRNCHANHKDCPCEYLEIAGSTGNVYHLKISHLPTCDCPANIFMKNGKDTACKHVLYVLHNVLKAPDHLKQQNAFLTSELKEIFTNAPALPSQENAEEDFDGNRKSVEGDCPICFTEFDDGDELVWCQAACGNNCHKACMDQWTKRNASCPFCRAPWQLVSSREFQKVNVANVNTKVERGAGGYRNVRDQLDYDED